MVHASTRTGSGAEDNVTDLCRREETMTASASASATALAATTGARTPVVLLVRTTSLLQCTVSTCEFAMICRASRVSYLLGLLLLVLVDPELVDLGRAAFLGVPVLTGLQRPYMTSVSSMIVCSLCSETCLAGMPS